MLCTESALLNLTATVLSAFGCDEHESTLVAEHLVGANLAGHDSHGVGMLPMYGEQVRDGNLIPNQSIEVVSQSGAITVVDGRRGFGHRMTLLALDAAMQTLPEHKVAILALKNTGHLSRTGHYSEYCAERGLVSLHFVNVIGHKPLVAPHGGSTTAFSTNPVSMAMPTDNTAYPMLDMATSIAAFGKVRVAHNKGESVPDGWLIDGDGQPTRDPTLMAGERIGAIKAFGEHKGSGLAIFAELLAGALVSGETIATASRIPNGAINNLFSVIVDPAAIGDVDAIADSTRRFCESISSTPPAPGVARVLLPGEPEQLSRQHRRTNGIDVDNQTMDQIIDIGCSFGLEDDVLRALLTE